MDHRPLPYGPGKSAPRLVSDLLDHDPRFSGRNGRNLLTDPAPIFRGIQILRKGPHECRHILMSKAAQSSPPASDDEKPDLETKYVVAAFCSNCRYHFVITVDFTQGRRGQVPCKLSDGENPMHHLRLAASKKHAAEGKYSLEAESYRFVCSGASCPVTLDIVVSPPRLPPILFSSILDATELEARGRRVIAGEPERYVGLDPLTPMQVFSNMRQYLTDAKTAPAQGEPRRIARRNKKYFLAFADECDDLFKYLDFKAVTDEPTESPKTEPSYFWQLPQISDSNRNFIDDALVELEIMISERPVQESKGNTKMRIVTIPMSAMKDIARSLGYWQYPTHSRTVDLSMEPHPHYASLGVIDNFTDEMLMWAYDRQCECDSHNKPYYLDCLKGFADGRQSSDLQTKYVMATSAGEYGLKEIEDAYRFFALDIKSTLTDDVIIGNYQSRIESAPRQKDEARNCLRKIARARNSEKIESVANDSTMSLNEALEFLGVTQDIESGLICSQASVMEGEIDSDRARIAAALRVIATERGGDKELNRMARDVGGDADLTWAYNDLDIKNRNITDETILYYYKTKTGVDTDNLKSQKDHAKALQIIADDRESDFLWAKIADPEAVVLTPNEPVGLDNIGNTCYLNSLLQFYYTIKAVRELVLNIDKYRMDLNSSNAEDDIRNKQVGGRKIKTFEVIKAQKFVDELHSLFELLRTASTKSVRPTNQLAELTLFSDALAADYRKKSISSPNGPPSLASILHSGDPVFGPELPPTYSLNQNLTAVEEDIEMVDRPGRTSLSNDSEASDATLVDGDSLPSLTEIPNMTRNGSGPAVNKRETMLETIDSIYHDDDAVMVNGDDPPPANYLPPPPSEKPPPIPPRNKAGLSIQTDNNMPNNDMLSFGAQQDVTEVIGNVVWRLSCAIKPSSIDESTGEQMDIIRDTFFGANAVYTQKASHPERKVESWAQLIVFPHATQSRDIYEALDVVFDEQFVDVENALTPQYASITKLPPILQIQIQRTDFDPINKVGFKNRNPVTLPETIYMDRYMDTSDPSLILRRREAWKWRAKLRALEKRQSELKDTEAKISVPEALIEAKNFLNALQEVEIEGLEVDASLPEALEERISEVSIELEQISSRISTIKKKLSEQFTDLTKYEYKLQTVFIHRGESGGGHYWIYLYDFESDIWREYNDDHVSIIKDRKRIFNPDAGQGGTPYYLAYVRSADKQDLVDAVVRDVREVEMADNSDVWVDQNEDEGIAMNDGESEETRHIEHVKPRPILPRPMGQQALDGWANGETSEYDANGNRW